MAQEGPPGLGENLDMRRSRPLSIVKRHLDGLEQPSGEDPLVLVRPFRELGEAGVAVPQTCTPKN